jgi:hypothetical protein
MIVTIIFAVLFIVMVYFLASSKEAKTAYAAFALTVAGAFTNVFFNGRASRKIIVPIIKSTKTRLVFKIVSTVLALGLIGIGLVIIKGRVIGSDLTKMAVAAPLPHKAKSKTKKPVQTVTLQQLAGIK